MLHRVESAFGPVIFRSPLLESCGVAHGFSTRIGGCSSGPFASLNFGNPSPCEERDPPENIARNFERLLQSVGAAGRELVQVHQVHGSVIHTVEANVPAHASSSDTKADALLTRDPRRVLAIRTADCAPILLASDDGTLVAAVHAGWRGTVGGVLSRTVERMKQLGARTIFAAIGPCIGAEALEVGPEVASEFAAAFRDASEIICKPLPATGKTLVDLQRALIQQLQGQGVSQIDTCPACTFRDADLFFSHRRERGITGRMASVIAPKGSSC